jgi:hypothetical protein
VLAALLCALAIAACGDDDGSNGDGGTATPSAPDYAATATARLASCPGQRAACIQGADAEVTFARGDVSLVTRAGIYVDHTCPDPAPQQLDPLVLVCEGQQPGDVVEGIATGRLQSEGVVLDRPGFRAFLQEWLAEIGTPPPFTSLGCPIAANDQLDCSERYVLVYTGPATNGVGELLMIVIGRDDTGRLGVTSAYTGIYDTGDPGFNKEIVLGGDLEWFPGVPGESATRYVPISPPGG